MNPSAIRFALLVFTTAVAAAAFAQDAPSAPTVDELVAALADESFDQREAASSALMLREDLDDTRLAAALRAADDPERRQRLIRIAMHRYFARLAVRPAAGPAGQHVMGCIGIDISQLNMIRPDQKPDLDQPGLLVTRTRVGFPAFAVMRPGDIVLSFEGKHFGEHLPDHQALVDLIQQYKAGQNVTLGVLRGGKRVDVPMVLDDLNRLRQVQMMLPSPDYPELYEPWQLHLRNMLGEDPAPRPIRIVPPAGRPDGAP